VRAQADRGEEVMTLLGCTKPLPRFANLCTCLRGEKG
jgi:hypothetical protein